MTGSKAVVLQIEAADRVLVSARIAGAPSDQAGLGLFLVDKPDAKLRDYPKIDDGRGGELTLAATPASLIVDDRFGLIEETVAAGIVALAWEAMGVMPSRFGIRERHRPDPLVHHAHPHHVRRVRRLRLRQISLERIRHRPPAL